MATIANSIDNIITVQSVPAGVTPQAPAAGSVGYTITSNILYANAVTLTSNSSTTLMSLTPQTYGIYLAAANINIEASIGLQYAVAWLSAGTSNNVVDRSTIVAEMLASGSWKIKNMNAVNLITTSSAAPIIYLNLYTSFLLGTCSASGSMLATLQPTGAS